MSERQKVVVSDHEATLPKGPDDDGAGGNGDPQLKDLLAWVQQLVAEHGEEAEVFFYPGNYESVAVGITRFRPETDEELEDRLEEDRKLAARRAQEEIARAEWRAGQAKRDEAQARERLARLEREVIELKLKRGW